MDLKECYFCKKEIQQDEQFESMRMLQTCDQCSGTVHEYDIQDCYECQGIADWVDIFVCQTCVDEFNAEENN